MFLDDYLAEKLATDPEYAERLRVNKLETEKHLNAFCAHIAALMALGMTYGGAKDYLADTDE